MGLLQSFEKQGSFLFKYRGQFPVLLFILVVPFIYTTDYSCFSGILENVIFFISVFISFLGFLIRFYTIGTTAKGTSGRNTKKQVADELNSSGMYSMLRHPLYLGNYLIWIGICISVSNILFIVLVSLLFWLYYERIMFAEECFLENKFGKTYIDWSNSVPAFFPNLFRFKRSNVPFSIISVLRREYASVFSAVIGFIYVIILKTFFEKGVFLISQSTFQVFIITLIIVVFLRSLKHYTSLLDEKGRS